MPRIPDSARRSAAAALLAAPVALLAAAPTASGQVFTPGNYNGDFFAKDGSDELSVDLDIDGDGVFDVVVFEPFDFTYGDASALNVEAFGTNEVFTNDFSEVIEFASPVDILTADRTDNDFFGQLWVSSFYTSFEDGGFAGFVFDIPGGSPYFGYLEIDVATNAAGTEYTGFTVVSSGFRAIPEPATAGLMAMGAAGLLVRRRR
jgi:hypothetical protein